MVMTVLAFSFVFQPSVAQQVPAPGQPMADTGSLIYQQGIAALEKGDYKVAVSVFQQLATNGDADAQVALGVMYFEGKGVPQDYLAAFNWYQRSAEQGHAMAQFNLGNMYLNGEGVRKDQSVAANWLRMAAEQGLIDAQFNLGLMYFRGEGVPQDYVNAHKWLNLSAVGGSADSVGARDIVAASMTPTQLGEAQRLAREWRKK